MRGYALSDLVTSGEQSRERSIFVRYLYILLDMAYANHDRKTERHYTYRKLVFLGGNVSYETNGPHCVCLVKKRIEKIFFNKRNLFVNKTLRVR